MKAHLCSANLFCIHKVKYINKQFKNIKVFNNFPLCWAKTDTLQDCRWCADINMKLFLMTCIWNVSNCHTRSLWNDSICIIRLDGHLRNITDVVRIPNIHKDLFLNDKMTNSNWKSYLATCAIKMQLQWSEGTSWEIQMYVFLYRQSVHMVRHNGKVLLLYKLSLDIAADSLPGKEEAKDNLVLER